MKKTLLCAAVGMISSSLSHAATENKFKTDEVLFGAAYYDEYSPHDRLDKDIKMIKEAGINIVRIAESMRGSVEPQDGVYDFHYIDRVLDAMHKAGIKVIIGKPIYAVPT
jgi:beta-galactosidase